MSHFHLIVCSHSEIQNISSFFFVSWCLMNITKIVFIQCFKSFPPPMITLKYITKSATHFISTVSSILLNFKHSQCCLIIFCQQETLTMIAYPCSWPLASIPQSAKKSFIVPNLIHIKPPLDWCTHSIPPIILLFRCHLTCPKYIICIFISFCKQWQTTKCSNAE